MRSSILITALAFSARAVLAALPPACLLHAVNNADNPADLGAVCGDNPTDVQEAIASLCGDNAQVAQSAFIATCSGAGHQVAAYTASTTSSSSDSEPTSAGTFIFTTEVYDPDCSCTTTIVTSSTGGLVSATRSASASGSRATSSGSAVASGNAAAAENAAGKYVAVVVVAVVGVVAAL